MMAIVNKSAIVHNEKITRQVCGKQTDHTIARRASKLS